MATIPPKKPSTPSNPRRPSATPTNSSNSNPNRSPSRMAASGSASATGTGSATNGVNRTRSVRTGAPPSARATARKPATTDNTADADAKAELNAKMEELSEQLRQAEENLQDQQRQTSVLQAKLDDTLKEQGILDERVHEQSERIEELENEKKESLRARRELEQIYESERVSSMKEKEESLVREEELQSSMQRMKETLAQREMRAGLDDERKPSISRNSSFRRSMDFRSGDQSPGHEGGFAPSSMQRSDSRSSSKLVMQKDKIIEGLRLELAEAQIKLVEMENMGGGRLQELERTMYDVKVQNARLMEENESFQLLLSEKTLNGDFTPTDFLRPPSPGGAGIGASRPTSRHANTHASTLADELGSQIDESEISFVGDDGARKAQGEINSLRDQNKALTLYINNIISRLLQHEQFEQILDKTPDLISGPNAAIRRTVANTDKDLPPPPPPKNQSSGLDSQEGEQEQQSMGFLQRARSVVTRPKPRPLSQATSDQPVQTAAPSRHENPATAPQIPLGRSQSVRGGAAHRRANSEWAAGVVGNMYRGPVPGAGGALSPGLGSPRERNSFFGPQPLTIGGGSSVAGSRVPSGNATAVPSTIVEKENLTMTSGPQSSQQQPSRDSKLSNTTGSSRNSVQSNLASTTMTQDNNSEPSTDAGAELSAPTSPPRSITSSGDRDSRVPGGAIMMGSKMRPLRLVQEAVEQEEKEKKQANRGSWFGWMNKGGVGGNSRAVSGEGGGQ